MKAFGRRYLEIARTETPMKATTMLVGAVLAATAVGVVAYDRGRARDDSPLFASAALHTALAAKLGGFSTDVPTAGSGLRFDLGT